MSNSGQQQSRRPMQISPAVGFLMLTGKLLACFLTGSAAIPVWHMDNLHLRPERFPVSRIWLEALLRNHSLQYEKLLADGGSTPSRKESKKSQKGKS